MTENIFNTTRLTITFGNNRVGADIEPGVAFLDALREIIKGLEQRENGDFEEVEIDD